MKSGIALHQIKESYDYTVKLQPYYHESYLSHLDIFWSSHCHSLYYNMQINTSTNTDSSSDPQSTLSVLRSRIISNISFYLIQNTLVVIFQTESRLVSENQLTQITWQSFENQLAQIMRKISTFSTSSSLDRMACYQRNLPISVRALRPL